MEMNTNAALQETVTYDELQRTDAPHLCKGNAPPHFNEKVVSFPGESEVQLAETVRYR